jgi:hypothetical protein
MALVQMRYGLFHSRELAEEGGDNVQHPRLKQTHEQ